MFGSLGFSEIMMILVIGLIIFGPKKLPEIGRSLGKALREFRRASNDIVNTFTLDTDYSPAPQRNYNDFNSYAASYAEPVSSPSSLPADDINVAQSPEEPYHSLTDEDIPSYTQVETSHTRTHTGRRRVLVVQQPSTARRNTRRRV